MNNIFNAVELKMLEELAKNGVATGGRRLEKKKYLRLLISILYTNREI